MKHKVLCAGAYQALQRTLFIASFEPGAVNRIKQVHVDVAGKAVNAARALRCLGGNPLLAGFSGAAPRGAFEQILRAEGMDCSGLWRVAAPVRICQTILPADGSAFTELIEEGPELPEEDWLALGKHCRGCMQTSRTAATILAGTMPKHASLAFYPDLIEAASGPVVLDTSGPALLAALPAKPGIVKINADELRTTFGAGKSDDLRHLAERLIAAGAGAVGITQGAGTALWVTAGRAWSFRIPPVAVASALGSGDCVNAGIVHGLLEGRPAVEAYVLGLACGSANAETAHPGRFDPLRVAALVQRIQYHAL